MASASDQTPWPFLAVLVSSRGGDRPVVRGLGFRSGHVVVTLRHIAETAEAAELATESSPRAVRPLTAEGELALLALAEPPPEPAVVVLGVAKGPVTVAQVSDISSSIQLVQGFVDEPGAQERFTVALQSRLGEDYTVAGSPVVAGGVIVGIAGPTAGSGSLDAFGAEPVRRLLEVVAPASAPPPPEELSVGTDRALEEALWMADACGPAAALLLGVLRSGATDSRATVPAELLTRVGPERVAAAYQRFVERPVQGRQAS